MSGELDALLRHAYAAEPEAWPEAVPAVPLPRQIAIVNAAVHHCRRAGVTVPAFSIQWVFANPSRRGLTVCADGRMVVTLNVRLAPEELRATAYHELWHCVDVRAGTHTRIGRVALEERAVLFSNRMMAAQ